MNRLQLTAVAVGSLVALIGLTFVIGDNDNLHLARIAAYLCAVAGLTVLVGISGQLSLGHAALMAGGGYGYVMSAEALVAAGIDGIPLFFIPLLVAVVVSALLGFIIGLAAARLHGPYLAGVTLALVVALPAVTSFWSSIFRGDQGIPLTVPRRPEAFSEIAGVEQWQAWVSIAVAVVVMVLLYNLIKGRFGRNLSAVRDNEVAAALNGINVPRAKVVAFTVSSVAAGLGGAVLAYTAHIVSPGFYPVAFSLFLLMAAVVGGIGTLAGAIWGSVLLVVLPDAIGSLTKGLELSREMQTRLDGNLEIAIFGTVLVLVVILAPRGIQGLIAKLRGKLRRPQSM